MFRALLGVFACLAFVLGRTASADLLFTIDVGPLVDETDPTPLGGASVVHSIRIPETGTYVDVIGGFPGIEITSWTIAVTGAAKRRKQRHLLCLRSVWVAGAPIYGGFGMAGVFDIVTGGGAFPTFTLNDATQFNVRNFDIQWTGGISPVPAVGNAFSLTPADFTGLTNVDLITDQHFELTSDTTINVQYGQFNSYSVAVANVPKPSSIAFMALTFVFIGGIALSRRRKTSDQQEA